LVKERPPPTLNPVNAGRAAPPIAADDVVAKVPVKPIAGVGVNDQIDPEPAVLSAAIMAPVDDTIAKVEVPLNADGAHKPDCEVVNHAPPALLE
jgi:hypothetical protein